MNGEGPGDPGSPELLTLAPRNVQGETPTTRQSYAITATQEIFYIQVGKSGGGNTNGLYPRQLIKRSELSSVAKRYVFDTHNPQNSDNKSVAIDVLITGSVLFVEVRTPLSPLVVTIQEVSVLIGGLKGDKGDDSKVPGPPGKDGSDGNPQGLKIAETSFSLDESATITAQDWLLTADSAGNLISGQRLSLRTHRPTSGTRDHTARIGYMFRIIRSTGGGNVVDSTAIYLYGDSGKLEPGINAQISSTLAHGSISLTLSSVSYTHLTLPTIYSV